MNKLATRGRPSKYNRHLGYLIAEAFANGQTVRDICKADGMPHRATVINWKRKHPDFKWRMDNARS